MASMESDPEGRNNAVSAEQAQAKTVRLNEVRPRRPEQFYGDKYLDGYIAASQ